MSSHNRNRKRNRNKDQNPPSNQASPDRESGRRAARRILNNMPLPTNVTFLPHIHVCPGDPPPPPTAEESGNATTQTRRESRANSIKRALRSKLLFPLELMDSINDLAADFTIQMGASTALESWLMFELARCTTQSDLCNDQLLIDKVRVVERVGTCWDDDNFDRCEKLLDKLPVQPYRMQRALARTKHGALLLIDKLSLLLESIDSIRGMDEVQYQNFYDLLGIDHVFRTGSTRVPAATAVVELRAAVTREIEKHRANLERTLNARSESEKEMAQMGLARFRDSITRSLRADLNRARNRISWVLETFAQLKRGADPAQIIDPETGRPVAVGPPPAVVPDRARPASSPQPQATPQPANPPAAPASPVAPPLPAGWSEERKAMWSVAVGTILSQSATPARDEAGPPPTTA